MNIFKNIIVVETPQWGVSTRARLTHGMNEYLHETPHWGVSTVTIQKPKRRLHPHSIGSIIGQFKTACTKRTREIGYDGFSWQTRFYDCIIWNEDMLSTIRRYINSNPMKWERDRNNPDPT